MFFAIPGAGDQFFAKSSFTVCTCWVFCSIMGSFLSLIRRSFEWLPVVPEAQWEKPFQTRAQTPLARETLTNSAPSSEVDHVGTF